MVGARPPFGSCVAFPLLMACRLWPDLHAVYMAGDVRVSERVFWWMTLASVFLTALQLFWGYKIVKVISKGNLKGKDAAAVEKETD